MKRLAPNRLLATDLDNTLVGDRTALAQFNAWYACHSDRWRLAYLTGRSLVSAWELIQSQGLLLPDALVTDVGTVIHQATRVAPVSVRDYREDLQWRARMLAAWPGTAVCTAALEHVPGLRLQPGGSRPLRVGCQVSSPAAVAAAQRRLRDHRLAVQVVYSSGCDLDILPTAAGKGAALRHLVQGWNIHPGDVVVCGDSGNDLDMLRAGYPGVVVANAQPELGQAQLPAQVYRCSQPYARGILQGVAHWENGSRGTR